MTNSKLINKDALLAEIERLDEFYHTSKSVEGTAILDSLRSFIDKSEVKVEEFERPNININDAIEVSSRMKYIDDELKPIAEFILEYASWNLHKDEWSSPTLEVPLFRVLDALAQKGKPYCHAC
jgi:hypothetical protein